MRIWDASGAGERPSIDAPLAGDLTFDPSGSSGNRLLTADSDGTEQRKLRVWELPTGKPLMALAHQDAITGVWFSPEQNAMATLSGGLAYIWDASTGELLSQLSGARHVTDLEFSDDGRQLVTGTAEGIAARWLWWTEDLRAEACRRLTRNLSASEWQQYLGATPYQLTCANLSAAPR